MRTVHLVVSGKVQGVYYRLYCQEEALRLNLTGWIKNTPDGNVEILAQGSEVEIQKLIKQ